MFFLFIFLITDQKYLIVKKYQISNPGTIKRKDIKRLIGIIIIPKEISSIGKGIIKVCIITRNTATVTNKMIISTIIPLILGNLYNINPVGGISMLSDIMRVISSKFPMETCKKITEKIEKNPEITEIAKKFFTNSGSVNGPLAKTNRGNVNAASF